MKILLVKDRNTLNTKFLVQFANSQTKLGHEVHILCDTYNKEGNGAILDSSVKVTNLSRKSTSLLKNLYIKLRKRLTIASFRFAKFIKQEKPDVIICFFMNDVYNVLFLQNLDIPVIMMHHKYPPTIIDKIKSRSKLKRAIYKKLFEKVAVHQVLMESFEKTIKDEYNIQKVATIPNEVVQIPDSETANLKEEKKKIIYVGRIKKSKGQHLLIEAFAKISKDFPEWTIDFWGAEKHEKYSQKLRNLIKENNLENNVFIKGFTKDINSVYRNADINAFPSEHEGFGLGLADGMAHGIPSIGFSSTPAVNELIKDNQNGFLVQDVEEFAQKLKLLMEEKKIRIKLGNQAREDMKQYAPEIVAQQWSDLIEETVKNRK